MGNVPSAKAEFPPLLPLGAHILSINEIRDLCVIPFGLSTTRGAIMDALEYVTSGLEGNGVKGELWIDGSFVTKKINPVDADIVLRCTGAFYDAATQSQKDAIDALGPGLYPLLDAYYFFEWPHGDPRWQFGQDEYDYWWPFFTTDRGGSAKGLAVIELGKA